MRALLLAAVALAACGTSRAAIVSGAAWGEAATFEYPGSRHAVGSELRRMLGLWEFRFAVRRGPVTEYRIYDRGRPARDENLAGRVRIESGDGPETTRVTAIGTRVLGFGWDRPGALDQRIHSHLAFVFH